MRCNRADLVSEADIRALGQQIGSQMANGYRDLKFRAPSVKPTGGRVAHETDGSFIMDFAVTLQLTDIPPGLKQEECVLWNSPFGELRIVPN
jgi:hypothetical protein